MKLQPIDFSKMAGDEAVARLEKAQALLQNLASSQKKVTDSKPGLEALEQSVGVRFHDGVVHGLCTALDFLQDRSPGTNLRDIMGVKTPATEPCAEALFV